MTSCPEVRPALTALLADNLPPETKAVYESHIASCAECGRALRRLTAMATMLENAPLRPEPDPDLERHILALVHHDHVAQLAAAAPIGPEPPADLEDRSLRLAGVTETRVRTRLGLWPRIAGVLAPTFGVAALVLGIMYVSLDRSTVVPDVRTTEPPIGHFMQSIELTGATGGAEVGLTHFKHDNYRITLSSIENLPPLKQGHHYEVWLVGPAGEVSAGGFRYIRPDQFTIDFNVGVDPTKFSLVEITQEPIDGNPIKNGASVCRGELDPAMVRH